MEKIKKFLISNWKTIFFIVLTIVFFSSILILSYDSTHYLKYVEILEKKQPFNTWDVVRGPTFPLIIFVAINLFGRNSNGLLIMFYLFYLIYKYCISKILDRIIPKYKYKELIKVILLCLIVFNPIVLGYYHTLLTENVALTFMALTSLISFIWLEKDNKKSKIAISIYYIFATTFLYFLKQPYAYIAMVPMLISSAYSIYKNHTLKNVRYHIINFVLVVLVLAASIVCWNKILVSKGVEMKSDRTSDGMLKTQIIGGSGNIKLSTVNYDEIKDDTYLDENEKKTIEERSKDGKSTVLVTIKKYQDIVSKDIVEVEKINDLSVAKSISLLGSEFFNYPGLITESYLKNYCAMTSTCVIKYGDDGLYVTEEYEWKVLYENSDIAYKTFTEWGTFYYVSEDGAIRSQDFVQPTHPGSVTKTIGKTMIINGLIYKYLMLIFPLIFIVTIILGKVLKNKINDEQAKIFKYTLFLFGSAFICLVANIFVGLFIDRYAIFAYPSILLGLCGLVLLIISLFTNKNKNDVKNIDTKKAKKNVAKKTTKKNKKKDK